MLVGAGSNALTPFTPLTNAPEVYKYKPMPNATMIIMINQIFALIIIK